MWKGSWTARHFWGYVSAVLAFVHCFTGCTAVIEVGTVEGYGVLHYAMPRDSTFDYNCTEKEEANSSSKCLVQGSAKEIGRICDGDKSCKAYIFLRDENKGYLQTGFDNETVSLSKTTDIYVSSALLNGTLGLVARNRTLAPELAPSKSSPTVSQNRALNAGAIAGAVLVVPVVALALLVLWLLRARRRRRSKAAGFVNFRDAESGGQSALEMQYVVPTQLLGRQKSAGALGAKDSLTLYSVSDAETDAEAKAREMALSRVSTLSRDDSASFAVGMKDASPSLRSSTPVPALPEHEAPGDWRIDPQQLNLLTRPDGSPWLLGMGSFGKVYKATYQGRAVAVKLLLEGGDRGDEQRFLQEVEGVRGCRSAYIVPFVGALVQEGQSMLVTQFMDGGDLAEALQRAAVPGEPSYQWRKRGRMLAMEVAWGLHDLHRSSLTHLGLKPANVLFSSDGRAHIADVGMAGTLCAKLTQAAGGRDSDPWIAPEVFAGHATERSDVFSFGVVLWQLVTYEKPERGHMRAARVPEECPREIAVLIQRCMDDNPWQRPTAKEAADTILLFVT